MEVDTKSEFKSAVMGDEESILDFATRLEGLARRAYGTKYERVLRKKFLKKFNKRVMITLYCDIDFK